MRNGEHPGSMRAVSECSRRAESSARKGPAMRSLGRSLCLFTVLGVMCVCGRLHAQGTGRDVQTPPPAALLKLRPNLPGIEYDTPADEATRNACKVESVVGAGNAKIGYALRDPQGK